MLTHPPSSVPIVARLLAATRSGRFGSRFAVILSGELIQALFHFVLNIVLVRTLSMHDYGLFAIVFTTGAVGIAYIRALVGVPATLFLSRSLARPAERAYDVLFGTSATLVAALMCTVATLALWPLMGWQGIAGGLFIAFYAFRSYLRIVLLARKQSRIAGLSDLVYAASGIALTFLLVVREVDSALEDAFLALAVAHALGTFVSYAALKAPVRPALRPRMLARYAAIRRTLAWSLVGITSITLQGQGLTLVFAVLAGPAAYAPIAATLVLYAPLRIPTNALTNMVLPEITGLLAAGRNGEARNLVLKSCAMICLACLVYGAAMWALLPTIEHVLFKGRFVDQPMGWIGFGVWSVVTISLLYAIPRAYLEASAAFRTIATCAIASAALGFAIMIPILLTLPSAFALIGLAASEGLTCLWSGSAFWRLARKRAEEPGSGRPAREEGPVGDAGALVGQPARS